MKQPTFNDLTDALSAPIGDLIASVGQSMADAQRDLDAATIENFKTIHKEGEHAFNALREIGYQPTWYQIPEVSAEVNMALTVSGTNEETGKKGTSATQSKGRIRLYGMPVDATFTNKYGFEYQAASKINFRIVPIPPSAEAEGMKVAPRIIGLSYEMAEQRLQELSINYRLHDDSPQKPKPTALIKSQSVEPGEIIQANDTLVIGFK